MWALGDPPEHCPQGLWHILGQFVGPRFPGHEERTEGDIPAKRHWAGSPAQDETSHAEPQPRTALDDRELQPETSDDNMPLPSALYPDEDLYYGPRQPPATAPPASPIGPRLGAETRAGRVPLPFGGRGGSDSFGRPSSRALYEQSKNSGSMMLGAGHEWVHPAPRHANAAAPWLDDSRGPRARQAAARDGIDAPQNRFLFDPQQLTATSTPAPAETPRNSQPPTFPFTFRTRETSVGLGPRVETPAIFHQQPPNHLYAPQAGRGAPIAPRPDSGRPGSAISWQPAEHGAHQQHAHPPQNMHDNNGYNPRADTGTNHTLQQPANAAVDYRAFQADPAMLAAIPEDAVPALRPSWLPTSNDAPLALTPKPPGGWPVVHRSDPEQPVGDMPLLRSQEVFESAEDNVLLAQPFNVSDTPSARAANQIVDTMASMLQNHVGELPCIVTPEVSDRGRPNNVFIIYGLSQPAGKLARDQEVYSTAALTFRVFPRTLRLPLHVLLLGTFTGGTQTSIEQMVRWNLAGPLRQSIVNLVEQNPIFANMSTDDAVQRILGTLRVRLLALSNGTRFANVYIRSPTHSIALWQQWVAQLRAHEWRDRSHSTVYARRVAHCPGCTSSDHPAFLCPFPHIPGWNGPLAGVGTHTTIPPPATAPPSPGPSAPRSRHDHGPSNASRHRYDTDDRGRGRYGGVKKGRRGKDCGY